MIDIRLLFGLIVATGLVAAIIESSIKKWSGDQLKRGLLAYGGRPPESSNLWERVYWLFEQKPRVLGALLESPLSIWCALTVALIIPFEWWLAYFIQFSLLYSLVLLFLLFDGWLHSLDFHRNILVEVEYIRTKEELERHKETP